MAAFALAPTLVACSLLDWSGLHVGSADSGTNDGARDGGPLGDGDGASVDADAGADADSGDSGARCNPLAAFSAPVLLQGTVNTANDNENDGFLTPNELTLYFSRDKGDGSQFDIFVATRPDLDSPFGEPTAVPGLSSATNAEEGPFLSRDGTTMFFTSSLLGDRPHIYSAKAEAGGFGAPVELTALSVVSPAIGDPFFLSNATFYFSDLYDDIPMMATAQGGSFTTPKAIPGIPTPASRPRATDDDLVLTFTAAGGVGREDDIFIARRPSTMVDFSDAKRIEELSTTGRDSLTWLSADGCHALVSQVGNSLDLYSTSRGF